MMKNAVALAFGLLLLSDPGWACQGKTIIFEDTFQDESGGWEEDKDAKVKNSAMVVTIVPQNTVLPELNATFFVKDADLCMEGSFPSQPQGSGIGLIFWASDYKNYYLFLVKHSGSTVLTRRTDGKWVNIFDQDSPLVKTERGAVNLVRVVIKGNLISTFVNGSKIKDTRAQPPQGESRFGFYTQIDKPQQAEDARIFTFKSYRVTSVE
jgi:hypothetical protein